MCEHFSNFDKMSILKFFKPHSKALDEFPKKFPGPNGPLSKMVPPVVHDLEWLMMKFQN